MFNLIFNLILQDVKKLWCHQCVCVCVCVWSFSTKYPTDIFI